MKYVSVLFFMLLVFNPILGQQERFIEVTGSAEMLIEPDEIIFNIGIAEYWENEFKNAPPNMSKGEKINILNIEQQLLSDLKAIGIPKKDIKSTDVGNSWRGRNEEIRMRKAFEITLTDFSKINRIISEINTLGVEYMRIGALKHKDIIDYRIEVKKKALLSAQGKAAYLAETLGKTIGDVISIKEITGDRFYSDTRLSNSMMESSSSGGMDIEKKIKLRYEILARFNIVDYK